MGIRNYKPTSPGRRGMTVLTMDDLTKKKPERALTESRPGSGGRNNLGETTVWHRGGGHKRKYRIVDFKRNKKEVREAVEKMFKVKVEDVRTMIVAGKVKRRGRTVGLRPGWKKAVVVLKAGDKIEFFEGV